MFCTGALGRGELGDQLDRMLSQDHRHEKAVVWCGELGVETGRRHWFAVRSHVLQVDATGLADDREMEQKKGQSRGTEREN